MTTAVDGGILTVTMHPQVIGRGHRIAMLTQFIAHCRQYHDLSFVRLDALVAQLCPPDVAAAAPA